jgi:D-aminopeptidase
MRSSLPARCISVLILPLLLTFSACAQETTRARDLGVPFFRTTGQWNAITDVAGVEVGFSTIIRGDGKLVPGEGPVRTGVTAVLPRGRTNDPVFAAWYTLNGNGEMTGTTWIKESGFLETPFLITNTFSVGVVRDATVAWMSKQWYQDTPFWYTYPVVAETYDGFLNDIVGQHVTAEHTFEALDAAASGPVAEGNVGGGTGMMCHGFKCGTGTSSRLIDIGDNTYTVGVLVQANYGGRANLSITGAPVGQEITDLLPEYQPAEEANGRGSIIVVVATDAPLVAHQLQRVIQRVPLAIGRMGGQGSNGSGDIFLAFSTANPGAHDREGIQELEMLPNDQIGLVFDATISATEEAIVNAMLAAETMVGVDGNTAHAIPHDRLVEALKKYSRFNARD